MSTEVLRKNRFIIMFFIVILFLCIGNILISNKSYTASAPVLIQEVRK